MKTSAANDILKDEIDLFLSDIGILKIDLWDKMVRSLRNALLLEWNETSKAAINDAIRKLAKGNGSLKAAEIAAINNDLEVALGSNYVTKIADPLYEFHAAAYTKGQKQIYTSAGISASFDLTDKKALRVLNEHNIYWVGQNYRNNLYDSVEKIGTSIIEQGLSRADAGQLFEAELADQLQKYGKVYWEGFANHVITRSREIGRVEAYVQSGATTYQVVAVIDENTSEICLEMNGRTFTVKRAVDLRDKILNAKTPDDVKVIAPWRTPEEIAKELGVDSMSDIPDDDLPEGMEFPPYHFRCRSRTVIVD